MISRPCKMAGGVFDGQNLRAVSLARLVQRLRIWTPGQMGEIESAARLRPGL